jgi:hypothetical protein
LEAGDRPRDEQEVRFMNRRVLFAAAFLTVLALLALGIQASTAQDGGTVRIRTVTVNVTQYVWDLVWNADGRFICQVIVEHRNQPTNAEAIQICGDQIFPPVALPTPYGGKESEPTPTASAGPFDLADFFNSVSWRFVETRQLTRQVSIPVPQMTVNITVPPAQQGPPFFVTLTGYEPVYGERITSISGVLNGMEFVCQGPRCDVPIQSDSVLEFWATSSVGDETTHLEAVLRIYQTESGIEIRVESLTPVTLFQDACAAIWTNADVRPEWAQFPASPEALNTQKPYQYLAAQLLAANLVNAADCPGGGLMENGAANACGLERAADEVVAWQNQFDPVIWETGRTMGIPPRLIKVLIEQESQFWPGNSRRALYEFGLGQLSPVGIDVALRWDNDLFARACNGMLYDCSSVYGRMTSWQQATLRGGLLSTLDAECPTCPNGIDMAVVYDSIPVITGTLRANCRQVQYLMDTRSLEASYEDLWKFTFLSYHSGYNCLATALDYTIINARAATWRSVSGYLRCAGGSAYVDSVWRLLSEFNTFRTQPPPGAKPEVLPTFKPTPETPLPTATPTPVLAMSKIRVLVYVDKNANNYPDGDERVEDAAVTVTLPNGQVMRGATAGGEILFSMAGRPIGEEVLVALPELFRTQTVRVTRDGEIPVVFRLEEPVVPPVLP